jgi:hypothetical protein
MSEPEGPRGTSEDNLGDDLDEAPRTINLWVVYGLMFLALLVAIGLATLIVLPFYQHRR